jgi:2,3-bisphosphoglycerate-dependent phosphoglycerate mutase
MKKILLLISLFTITISFAQKTTYILVRHAEKDTTTAGSTMMASDPPLTKAGEARAQRLVETLKKYTPDAIYSTNYTRTKNTVLPLTQKLGLPTLIYNPKDLNYFAEQLLKEKDKTIVIAGHSNTTPTLVNLLTKKNSYPALDESVYNKIYIVTINNSISNVEVIEY